METPQSECFGGPLDGHRTAAVAAGVVFELRHSAGDRVYCYRRRDGGGYEFVAAADADDVPHRLRAQFVRCPRVPVTARVWGEVLDKRGDPWRSLTTLVPEGS